MNTKKRYAFAVLALLLTSAVSAAQYQSFTANGHSRTDACQTALNTANYTAQTMPWKKVISISECQCSQTSIGWECLVTVSYAD